MSQPGAGRGTRTHRGAGREDTAMGYPGGALCPQRAGEAGRGLVLPIASKEPLSDKKLKRRDYLGRMIFRVLQLLPKTTPPRPVSAGNRGIPWTKDGPNSPETAQRGGLCGQAPPGRCSWDCRCCSDHSGTRGRQVPHWSCVLGQRCAHPESKFRASKGNWRKAAG